MTDMSFLKTITISTVVLTSLITLSACRHIPSYSSDYSNAEQKMTGITLDDAQALAIGNRFVSTFHSLGTAEFIHKADRLYADQLYINDTLSQFSDKKTLLQHFEGMNKRVTHVTVKLISATHHQDSAYIHWSMAYDFKMLGRTKSMKSYGISEIKVNPQNQIIFQQDFWDPANGLFRALPVFGGAYGWILPFKKSN